MLNIQEMIAAAMELAEQLSGNPDDVHEIQFRLRQLIDSIKATGMPLPDDLARLEADLERDLKT